MNKSQREQFSYLGPWKIFKLTVRKWLYFNFRYTYRGYYLFSSAACLFLCIIFINNHVYNLGDIPLGYDNFRSLKVGKKIEESKIKKSSSNLNELGCRVNLRDLDYKIIIHVKDIKADHFLVSYKCADNKKISLEVIDSGNNIFDRIYNYGEAIIGEVILDRKFKKPEGDFSIRFKFSQENLPEDDLKEYDLELDFD